jgi:hypothetical protein
MATRNLPPSLFSAKAAIALTKASTQYLHFVAVVRQRRNQFVFVCESTPLMSFGCHGLPGRCPACGARIHPEAYSEAF